MTKEILLAAAVPFRAARYPDPPEIHAIYFDSVSTDAQGINPDVGPALSFAHDCTVELYAPTIEAGDSAFERIRDQLQSRGIRYTTQGWYWLSSIRRYQEVIEFSYIEKRRN